MDAEISERFDQLDQQIAQWRDVIAANSKAVSDMATAFAELRGFRQPYHVQIEPLGHVPTWLNDAVWVGIHSDLVTVPVGSGRA
jgi:hypothetical protein